jgi:colanic acid biosynthesis glycosyl transferase WcaI
MRILLVIIQFPPDVNSTGILMSQLCEGLLAQGHEVSVITTLPHYEKFRVWEEYRGRLFEQDRFQGMDVLRLWVYAPGNKSMINRLLSYLSFNALATVAGLLSRKQWDVILCTNGSFFSGLTGWLVGRSKGAPFIYNVQDLYPEVPVQANQLRNSWAITALGKVALFMYRRAAHITVISPTMRESLLGKGVPEEKLTVIPNFVDLDFIRPLPKVNPFSQQHALCDKFVITHAGNLGYVYDLETLLEAAALLAEEKQLFFLIVGDGVARAGLQQKAEALHLQNVAFLPFQPHESLPYLRASSDVQVSLYKNGSVKHSMPSKVYEIMASGRPLLASSETGSELWRLVEQTQCGICVEPENAEQLASAILRLYRNHSLREEMAQNGRRIAEQYYSKQAVVQAYHHLIQRVVGEKATSRSYSRKPGLHLHEEKREWSNK